MKKLIGYCNGIIFCPGFNESFSSFHLIFNNNNVCITIVFFINICVIHYTIKNKKLDVRHKDI